MFEKASRKRISHVQIVNSLVRSYRLASLAPDRLTLSDHTLLARLIPRSRYLHFFKLLTISIPYVKIVNSLAWSYWFLYYLRSIVLLYLRDWFHGHATYISSKFLIVNEIQCLKNSVINIFHILKLSIHLSDHIDYSTICARSSYSTCSINSTVTLLTFLQSF